MSNRGLVSVVEGGTVVLKVVALTRGDKARELKESIEVCWPMSSEEVYQKALDLKFGTKGVLIVFSLEEVQNGEAELMVGPVEETFDDPVYNPFSKNGKSDYIEVLEV